MTSIIPTLRSGKQQLNDAFNRDIEDMKNPDPRIKVKKKRTEKAKKIAKKYGM